MSGKTAPAGGLLAPLRTSPVFRVMWSAQAGIQVSVWVQTITAQWILVDRGEGVAVVALVQSAISLPVLLFGVPAGVLADLFSRRQVTIWVNWVATAISALLVVLEVTGAASTLMLLLLLSLLGVCQGISQPAWNASVPDIVDRDQVTEASMLASINFNLGRVIGPALGGFIIAWVGAPYAFIVCTLAYAALAICAQAVGPYSTSGMRQNFGVALSAGVRHVIHSRGVVRIILLTFLWFVSAGAFWALLPVLALRTLQLDPAQFGLVLALVGGGAVVGTPLVAPLRRRVRPRVYIGVMAVIFVVSTVVFALVRLPWLDLLVLPVAGITWTTVGSILGSNAQLLLPTWVRARALSFYVTGMQGGLGIGAILWGLVAASIGPEAALAIGALSLVVFLGVLAWRPLARPEGTVTGRRWVDLPRRPADHGDGRVMVSVEYEVRPADEDVFRAAMVDVRHSRLRTGGIRWHLYRDSERPDVFVEVYVAASWADHRQQHSHRQTLADERSSDRVSAVSTRLGSTRHLIEVKLG